MKTPLVTPGRVRIAVCTFLILYLELTLIRWLGAEIKLFNYFKNFVLMASFAGLGLGCVRAAETQGRELLRLPWCFLACVLVCVSATTTGLDMMFFPDMGVVQWNGSLGSPKLRAAVENLAPVAKHLSDFQLYVGISAAILGLVYGILFLVAYSFFALGRTLRDAFQGEQPLVAYSADIAGSLVGSLSASVVAFAQLPPVAWVALVAAATLYLVPAPKRRVASVAFALALAATTWHHVAHPNLRWSPYYQVEVRDFLKVQEDGVERSKGWSVFVNHTGFQEFHDLSPAALETYEAQAPAWKYEQLKGIKARHEIPFRMSPDALEHVLVVGSGTGNDVAAGLRLGAKHVDAVDIDPVMLQLGRDLHPEQPYSAEGVRVINNDARAFFERPSRPAYDLVVFGTLDSHSAVNAQSSLRLEYFVYTKESFEQSIALAGERGMVVVAFATGWKHWVVERMAQTMKAASGQPIRVFQLESEHDRHFFVVGPGAERVDWPKACAELGLKDETAAYRDLSIRASTDDWPYLYRDPENFPWVLVSAVLFNVFLVVVALLRVSRDHWPEHGGRAHSWAMFFMGAGFLLVETKAITELSLVFGATWLVNAIVFSSVLTLILVANLRVLNKPGPDSRLVLGLLLVYLGLKYAFAPQISEWYGTSLGRALSPLVACGPAVFASVAFARMFSVSKASAHALGWNVVGAVFGGGLELLAIFFGNRSLDLVALAIYAIALGIHVTTLGELDPPATTAGEPAPEEPAAEEPAAAEPAAEQPANPSTTDTPPNSHDASPPGVAPQPPA